MVSCGGVPCSGGVGIDICIYEAAVAEWSDSSTDFRAEVYFGLRAAAGILADEETFPAVVSIGERRTADGGTGRVWRLVVFPDGEQFDELYHDDEHIADSVPVSAVCCPAHIDILPLRTAERHPDGGFADGSIGSGGGSA